jgi:hypothetical protein
MKKIYAQASKHCLNVCILAALSLSLILVVKKMYIDIINTTIEGECGLCCPTMTINGNDTFNLYMNRAIWPHDGYRLNVSKPSLVLEAANMSSVVNFIASRSLQHCFYNSIYEYVIIANDCTNCFIMDAWLLIVFVMLLGLGILFITINIVAELKDSMPQYTPIVEL